MSSSMNNFSSIIYKIKSQPKKCKVTLNDRGEVVFNKPSGFIVKAEGSYDIGGNYTVEYTIIKKGLKMRLSEAKVMLILSSLGLGAIILGIHLH